MSRRKKALILLSINLVFLGILGVGFFLLQQVFGDPSAPLPFLLPPPVVSSLPAKDTPLPLTGELVTKDEANRILSSPPLAVMIENLVSVRLQYGLSRADLVYEAQVEGGISRLMAIYQSKEAEKIGPVRSLRPYFVDFALESGSVLAHVGGSPEGLARLRSLKAPEIEYQADGVLQRDEKLPAPHNVFTSTLGLLSEVVKQGFRAKDFVPWSFKDETSAATSSAQIKRLRIDFYGFSDYAVEWRYQDGKRLYQRYNGGQAQYDRLNNEPLQAANILLMYIETTRQADGRLKMKTLGSGKAELYRDGEKMIGTWEKEKPDAQTRYLDGDGRPFILNRGQTWIEIIPAGTPVAT